MAFPAFLDARVLYPFHLCDVSPRLAEGGGYRPLWSADVADVLAELSGVGTVGYRVGSGGSTDRRHT